MTENEILYEIQQAVKRAVAAYQQGSIEYPRLTTAAAKLAEDYGYCLFFRRGVPHLSLGKMPQTEAMYAATPGESTLIYIARNVAESLEEDFMEEVRRLEKHRTAETPLNVVFAVALENLADNLMPRSALLKKEAARLRKC